VSQLQSQTANANVSIQSAMQILTIAISYYQSVIISTIPDYQACLTQGGPFALIIALSKPPQWQLMR